MHDGREAPGRQQVVPYHLAIDRRRRLVTIRYWGTVTMVDFDLVRVALGHDPYFDPSFHVVTDLRDADMFGLSLSDIHSVATQSLLRPTARRAIIVDTADQLGLAHIYETQRELAGSESTRVFKSLEEAAAWLGIDGFDPAGFMSR